MIYFQQNFDVRYTKGDEIIWHSVSVQEQIQKFGLDAYIPHYVQICKVQIIITCKLFYRFNKTLQILMFFIYVIS